jgi:SAM-dependent methyltransferase
VLKRRADAVIGLDFAAALLRAARRRIGDTQRVTLRRADLAKPLRQPRGAGLVCCVNVLIGPDPKVHRAMLRNVRNLLAPGGHLLVIVPSLESALWVNNRWIDMKERDGLRGARALTGGIGTGPAAARDLLRGVVEQGGARTRHYLREELRTALRDHDLEPIFEDRVEYPWSAYIERPPRWLEAPLPWDWLLLARRR